MGIKTLLSKLVSPEADQPDNHETLLVRFRHHDGQLGEETVLVERSEIRSVCEQFAKASDVNEVWVFQRIYQADGVDAVVDAEMPVVVSATIKALKL